MFLFNTMWALEICPLTLSSWKRNVNDRGLERALAIISMRSYAIGLLHDFASEPFSAGFRTNLYGKHRSGSTQKAPRQQTFKFEEVRGDTTAKRVYVHKGFEGSIVISSLTPYEWALQSFLETPPCARTRIPPGVLLDGPGCTSVHVLGVPRQIRATPFRHLIFGTGMILTNSTPLN